MDYNTGMKRAVSFTKKCLFDALLQLMNKEEMNMITIRELTDTAGVSRTTFYRHYTTVEDVFLDYMRSYPFGARDTSVYEQPMDKPVYDWLYDRVYESLSFLINNKGFIQNLLNAHLESVMIDSYSVGIYEICRSKAAEIGYETDVELSAFCGMYFMICYDWVKSGYQKDINRLAVEAADALMHYYHDKGHG